MVKVSVIVPVYNAENHIKRTVESLLKQTLDDIEFILVNDGSKDNSLKIIKNYEKQYPEKIKVIDQKNSGPGGARNAGILVASGEYIGFLDSDDTQNENMYENMYKKAKEKSFDMVVCDTTIIYPDKQATVFSGIENDTFDKEQIKKDMIFSYAVIWNKIIKADIVKGNLFSKDLWYEDIEFLFKLFPKLNSIGVVKESFCNYNQIEGSITYTFNEKLFDIITILNNIISYYNENNLFEEYKDELEYSYVRYMFGTFIKRFAKTKNKKEYKKAVSLAINTVIKSFPNYKKNKYLNSKGLKNFYLRNFNKIFSRVIYLFEKSKMN